MADTGLIGKQYAVYRSEKGVPIKTTATIPTLGPHDLLIRITHSGVCHTDSLFCAAGYPLALGHEGVGVVESIGDSVTQFKVGDRAGGGFRRGSCGHCKYCLSGRDIQCYERIIFGEGDLDNGTFAEYYVGKETFLHRIPAALASEHAAPLQCAGATVYSALKATVTVGMRVGVFGIGGLGHLAIQYAAKMGAEVVVFSTSANKESEALEFGAKEFHLVKDIGNTESSPIDVLIVAGARNPDWNCVLKKEFLARDGVIVPLAAPVHGPISLPADSIFWNSYHVHSSLVASRQVHGEMLEFSALHGIKPVVQIVKNDGPEAIQRIFQDLDENRVRYRAVLEM